MWDAESFLEEVEAENHAQLYKCRWDPETAAETVPKLAACLKDSDSEVLRRALNALHRIGLPAKDGTPQVVLFLGRRDLDGHFCDVSCNLLLSVGSLHEPKVVDGRV